MACVCFCCFRFFPATGKTENVFTKKKKARDASPPPPNRNFNCQCQRDKEFTSSWDFWYYPLLTIHTSHVVSSSHSFKCLNCDILMCPASYQRKGLCKAVNCSLSYNPITTCLKVGLLLPYSVAGMVEILSGLEGLGLYFSFA